MTEAELKDRLRSFAIRIIKMVDSMPHSISSTAIAKQVVRSGTSPVIIGLRVLESPKEISLIN